jgi:hypothetical protein
MDIITKYNINIVDELIYLWEDTNFKNKIDIENLNEICINSTEIKISFSINYKYTEIYTFTNSLGFKIKDLLKIIFNYYNGLLSENEKFLFKKKKLDTRKELLIKNNQIYFEGLIFENNIYYVQIS